MERSAFIDAFRRILTKNGLDSFTGEEIAAKFFALTERMLEVNAYMNLSPTMKLFGTAINYGFGDVEETGILINIDEIFEEKRMRHIDTFIMENPDCCKITSGANNIIYKEK